MKGTHSGMELCFPFISEEEEEEDNDDEKGRKQQQQQQQQQQQHKLKSIRLFDHYEYVL